MADRLVQQNARPARAEHDIHLAGRCRPGLEIDQSDPQRLARQGLPRRRCQPFGIGIAPAGPGRTLFAAAILFDRDGDIDPHQRPRVAIDRAIGPQDFHLPPIAGEGDRDLHHPRIERAGKGVDGLQEPDLFRKFRSENRVEVRIKRLIGAHGALGHHARIAGFRRTGRPRRPPEGRHVERTGIGITRRLARRDPQAEALTAVVRGGFQPAVVEQKALGTGAFDEDLSVIAPHDSIGQDFSRSFARGRGSKVEIEIHRKSTQRQAGDKIPRHTSATEPWPHCPYVRLNRAGCPTITICWPGSTDGHRWGRLPRMRGQSFASLDIDRWQGR